MFHKNKKFLANGRVYVQGNVFYPGAESIAPARGVLPPWVATGTGYIPYDHVPIVGPPQVVSNQTAAPIGLGVQLGTSFSLTALQDNSISQES